MIIVMQFFDLKSYVLDNVIMRNFAWILMGYIFLYMIT